MESIETQDTQKNGAAKRDARPEARVLTPAVDVYEAADRVVVITDLPGVRSEDVGLRIEKDTLLLDASRKLPLSERAVVYRRAFFVPNDLDPERIEAKLADGVLTVTIPRRASSKPRQIAVQSG